VQQAPADARPSRDELDAYVKRVLEARDRLAPRFPDIDPGDLLLILQSLLRPPGWDRRFLLRSVRPGVHVS
jgi:hypothetical protein